MAWAASETVLHSFGSGSDGQAPFAGLTMDASGNLYGTASAGGGSGQCGGMGCGVVYRLTPAGGGNWNYSMLHAFTQNEEAIRIPRLRWITAGLCMALLCTMPRDAGRCFR